MFIRPLFIRPLDIFSVCNYGAHADLYYTYAEMKRVKDQIRGGKKGRGGEREEEKGRGKSAVRRKRRERKKKRYSKRARERKRQRERTTDRK